MSGQPNPTQATAAIPAWQAFLRPILSPRGAKAKIAEQRSYLEAFAGPGGVPLSEPDLGQRRLRFAKKQIDIYGRWLSETPPYSGPDTLWAFSKALQHSGHHWAAGPLVLFAAGHLQPFIEVLGTFNGRKIGPARLRELLTALPLAIEGDEPARRIWTLRNLEREAFLHPDDAAGVFRTPAGPLAVAYAVGQHFEIPYGFLRRTVLEYAVKWIEDLAH